MPFLTDQYQILEPLGKGSLGQVFKAKENNPPHRIVALKMVDLSNLTGEESLALLKKEFQLLKRLSHPHIVEVYDFGFDTQEKRAFLAQEFLEGETTSHQKLSYEEIIFRLGVLLRALHSSHRHHVFHGDIKPENIMILKDKTLKIIDFGFAQEKRGEKEFILQGTLSYLAPERLGGGAPSVASDLYALGVVSYEWATGRLPFSCDDPSLLIPAILGELPLSPRSLNSDLSEELSYLILSLLQKNPADRPSSGNNVLREMNARMNFSLPLEEEKSSTQWVELAGSVGREELLKKIEREAVEGPLSHGGRGLGRGGKWEGGKIIKIGGKPGMGKSAFLSVLYSKLQLEGLQPTKIHVKEIENIDSLNKFFSTKIPSLLLIDDFDLLPSALGESLRGKENQVLIVTTKDPTSPFWLKPLEVFYVKELVKKCFDLEGEVSPSFIKQLTQLSEGRPQFILNILTILLDSVLDPLGLLEPQLAGLTLKDYFEADSLTGPRFKKQVSLQESRQRLIQQTKERLTQDPKNESLKVLLARLLLENGDYQEVLQYVEFQESPKLYVDTLNKLGRFEEVLLRCQEVKKAEITTEESINWLNQEGTALYFLGRREAASSLFYKAVEMARKNQLNDRLAVALNNLANVVAHGESPMKGAPLYQEAIQIAKKEANPVNEGRAYANLGHLYQMVQDYHHALECYYKGANIYRQIGFMGEMAQIQTNLGTLFLELGALPQAEEALTMALKLSVERQMRYLVHYARVCYADSLRRQEKYKEATIYYQKAKLGFSHLNASEDLSRITLAFARMALNQQKYQEAKKWLLQFEERGGSLSLTAQAKFLKAELLIAKGGDLEEVKKEAEESLEIFEQLTKPDLQILIHIFLYKVYHFHHRAEEAKVWKEKGKILIHQAKKRVPPQYWTDFARMIPAWE